MRMFKTSIFFLMILFFFLNPISIYAAQHACSASNCGENNVSVRFPFQLQTQQAANCGYPGFDLLCSVQEVPILTLPSSGDFYVREINYLAQQIQIYDSQSCIPNRLLSLNLSGSPFIPGFHNNYTFLSCPTELVESGLRPIKCLSNSTISVLATSSESLVNQLIHSCRVIVSKEVPIILSTDYDEEFSDDLNGDVLLTWTEPNCQDCEVEGGTCGFKSNTTDEVGCFYQHKKGSSLKLHTKIIVLITLTLIGPAFSCAIIFAIRAYCVCRRRGETALGRSAVLPQPVVETMGLTESTIATYQKMVLGESLRLPGTNDDTTCPICLSEYNSKETIRSIPECQHCFHADCIDEWLRMNGTCPVCRNSPSPAHVNVPSPDV